ncbi:MAG: ABC transporter substrate-binding protein [Methylococcales bacterium]
MLFLLLAGLARPGLAQPSGAAGRVIESLNSALVDVMKNASALGYPGRYEKLAPVIESTHDLEYIARFSIGKGNWDKLIDEQRKKFVAIFTQYSIATYASRFNGYAGETFRVTGEQAAKRGQIQVTSVLDIPGKKSVNFLYLLSGEPGSLKIVNILVDGVSDLALKRAQFMTLIADQGFDALLKHLSDQTAQFAAVEK